MELKGRLQQYDWGKRGSSSAVALLAKAENEDFKVDECSPYAELWMGTHVKAPSILKESGKPLAVYLEENPALLGEKVAKAFNNKLPFLLKVLSVDKALSIQAHPSADLARSLHSMRPDIYKDANHKPELAIALTPFEAMCGFRPIAEIREFVKNIPELEHIVTCSLEEDDVKFLQQAFRDVITCDPETMIKSIDSLIERSKHMNDIEKTTFLIDLIERLHQDFPHDNGVMMLYFLNYIKLNPSESLYLSHSVVHAYLKGDCIEIMASSDNVVRAGLTSKLVDVETLCQMLIYKGQPAAKMLFHPIKEDDYTKLYAPPIQDFAVAEIRIPNSSKHYTTISRDSASIIIIISGSGRSKSLELKPGSIIFLASNEVLEITEFLAEADSILMYQGFANV